jgi:prepilin signal peptidase PulO-like enzyme (type II secretory pathway)
MNEMIPLYKSFAAIFGALIGSFLNVVIHRLPLGKELVVSRSACPSCQALIPWWCNVPVLSWLVLRGKCRSCRVSISPRYLIVEIISALIFFLSFPNELTATSLFQWLFLAAISCVLICHLFIDLQHKLLPDVLNIYLLCLVLPYAVIFFAPIHWLTGGGFGFLGPLAVSWLFYKWKGKVGLGGGDIKLWGVLGIFLGPFGILENIFMSCLLGSVVGISLILAKKYDRNGGIPFGPFIIVVTFVQIYFPGFIAKMGFQIF